MEEDKNTLDVQEDEGEEDLDEGQFDDVDEDDESEAEGEDGKKEEGDSEEEPDEKPLKETKKPSSQGQKANRRFAEIRRENARLKAEIEEMRKKSEKKDFQHRASAVSEDALEDLGISEIKTDEDLFLAEAYAEAVKNDSVNPIADAYKALNAKRLESEKQEREAKLAQEEEKKKGSEDIDNFVKKYGQEVYDSQIKNAESQFWKSQLASKVTIGNLTEMFSIYQEITELAEKKTMEKYGIKPEDETKGKGSFKLPNGKGLNNDSEIIDWNDGTHTASEFEEYWRKKYSN